jgi:ribosomal protein L37AE/L43A
MGLSLTEYIKEKLNDAAFLCCENCGKERWVLNERVSDGRIIWVCEKCAALFPVKGKIDPLPDTIYLD